MQKVLLLSLFLCSCATTNNVYRCKDSAIKKAQEDVKELKQHEKELRELHKKVRVVMLQDTLIYFLLKDCVTEEEQAMCLEVAKEEANWTPNNSLVILRQLNELISNSWIYCPNQGIGPVIAEIKLAIFKYTQFINSPASFEQKSVAAAFINEDIGVALYEVYEKFNKHVDSRYEFHCRRR